MPWSETTSMDARVAFILDWKSQKYQVTELCARHGVSRKTAYKVDQPVHRRRTGRAVGAKPRAQGEPAAHGW